MGRCVRSQDEINRIRLLLDEVELHFDTGQLNNIAVLDGLVGQAGWLTCAASSLSTFETEDHILFAGITDNGAMLDAVQCRRMFDVSAQAGSPTSAPENVLQLLQEQIQHEQNLISERLAEKSGSWFDAEMEKLDRWADDRRTSLKRALDELDVKIRETKREARVAPNLPTKLELQRQLRQLEAKRNDAWKEFDDASRDIERQKDGLLDEISQRLNQRAERRDLFTIRWRLV